jgi:hypothetical protein
MKKLLGAMMLLAGFAMPACAAETGTPSPSTTAEAGTALTISSESDTAIAGNFVSGASVVTFQAQLVSPLVNVTLVVNGASFDFSFDVSKGTLNIDGHANTLLGADADVLAKLEKAFDRLGNPTRIRESLYKTFAILGAAPVGTTLQVRAITPAANFAKEVDRSDCESDEGVTFLCNCNNVNNNAAPNGCGYAYGGTSSPGGTDGWTHTIWNATNLGSCVGTPTNNHEHEECENTASCSDYGDASQHGYGTSGCFWGGRYHKNVQWQAACGWQSKACEGRCGAGCPQSYNFYYTKDCHDHDTCLDNHPSAASNSTFGTCGNEWDSAVNDFADLTGSNDFGNACGGAAVGDNTR